jgi:hypothetical protein
MKRIIIKWIFFLMLLVCVGSSLAAQSEDSALTRYVLQGPARIMISVEKGWQRDGIVPVCVMVNGIESTLFMTPDGRVNVDRSNHLTTRSLFQLDATKGALTAGAWQRSGEIYEQNELRTRMHLNVENVELLLSADGKQAALSLAGLEIPLHSRLVKQPDDSEELCLGDHPMRGFERLLLDRASGTIVRETTLPGSASDQTRSTCACWAIGKTGENK